MNRSIRLSIVGACGRGSSFSAVCDAIGDITVAAICDTNEKALLAGTEQFGTAQAFTDYDAMLDSVEIDAVVIATPMPLHVSQSIAALRRDLHVICEVPAAVSVDECKQLVEAERDSAGLFMMAENYIYTRPNQVVQGLVDAGYFGTPYYAEAEYIHDVKEYATLTPWRRHWQLGIDGITYGTHSLGPILQWMPGDRVTEVCCQGTGVHHTDTQGEPFAQASSTMLCKTASGALIKIRVDLLSDRPHAATNYQLQGTDGCYESSRGGPGDVDKIWLRARDDKARWVPLDQLGDSTDLAELATPIRWRDASDAAKRTGHGGGDYFAMLDCIDAIRGQHAPAVGIHEAMDMTLPGLISQRSIAEDGRWLPVPDSRDW